MSVKYLTTIIGLTSSMIIYCIKDSCCLLKIEGGSKKYLTILNKSENQLKFTDPES